MREPSSKRWIGEARDDSDEAVKFIIELGIFAIENQDALVGGDDGESMPPVPNSTEISADYIEGLGFPFRS